MEKINKIVFFVGSVPPEINGVGQYTLNLAGALRKRGLDVRIITSTNQKASEDWIYPSVPRWEADVMVSALSEMKGFEPQLCILQYVPQMYGQYGICLSASRSLSLIQKKLGVKTAVMIHEYGGVSQGGIKNKVLSFVMKVQAMNLKRGSDIVFTNCARYVKDLKAIGEKGKPVYELPVGANTFFYQTMNSELEKQKEVYGINDEMVLGMLGRVSEARNFQTSIKILHSLREAKVPSKLILAGSLAKVDENLYQSLKEMIKRFDLVRDVIWTGELSEMEVSLTLQIMDVFLFAQCDGISTRNTTVMSALAHGLPLIAYQGVEGNFDGYEVPYGLLIDRFDEKAFIQGALQFLKGYDRNLDKRNRNTAYFETNFSWEVIAKQFLENMESHL